MPSPILLDLSHHQPPRDMQFAVDAGIGAVIVKATQGTGGHDPAYAKHAANVTAAGLRLGAYCFGSGSSGGADQANYFLNILASTGVPQVLVLDVENNPGGVTMSLSQAEDFVNTIRSAHPISTIMIYGGSYLRDMHVPKSSTLLSSPLWLAEYSQHPTPIAPWPSWVLWQMSDSGPGALHGYDVSSAFDGENTLKFLWNQ